jgi:hypothetical protein
VSAPAISKSHVGPANPNWRGGIYLNEKGYRRISWGRHRGKYEHRRVIEELLLKPLCADYVFPAPGIIPGACTSSTWTIPGRITVTAT